MTEELLLDATLVPDPDADDEMGPGGLEAIADEVIKDSRFLLVRRAAEPLDLEGNPAAALQFACTFQPASGTRFVSARLLLKLTSPDGIQLLDVAPSEVRESEPVRFTVDGKGKFGLNYEPVAAGGERSVSKEFAVYHCLVRGSGTGSNLARWDLDENPHTQAGVAGEQVLAITLPEAGRIDAVVSVTARLARSGLTGAWDAIRDLVLGPEQRWYPISFEIPADEPSNTPPVFERT